MEQLCTPGSYFLVELIQLRRSLGPQYCALCTPRGAHNGTNIMCFRMDLMFLTYDCKSTWSAGGHYGHCVLLRC